MAINAMDLLFVGTTVRDLVQERKMKKRERIINQQNAAINYLTPIQADLITKTYKKE